MVGERVMADVEHLHVARTSWRSGPVMRDEGFRRRLDAVVAQSRRR